MQLGIDLGTTFSAVASYDKQNNNPEVLLNREGKRITPSVVLFDNKGFATVGEVAKDNIFMEPENVISHVKDYMGTDMQFKISTGKSYSPEEVSAIILKKLLKDAQEKLGVSIKEAVITIPAYFNDSQRTATKDAARLAGLHNVRLINEPTAAAIYYAKQSKFEKGTVLIYDLGGGTFDVSIVEVSDNYAETIATGGIRKMGGHFFDQLIVNYVTDYFEEKHNIDLYEDEYIDDLQELILKAENAKIQLSSIDKTDIILKVNSIKDKIMITREGFEKKIEKFYLRTEAIINMVLKDANMTFKDIDKILLVGGSSKIPYIRNRIKQVSGIEPSSDLNPDEAVALGAAIFASTLSYDTENHMKVSDVCSHSLGIVTLANNTKKRVNTILIPRNSLIPISKSKVFYTAIPFQRTIDLEVTEGEDTDLDYDTIIANFQIDLPDGLKERTPVNITFRLDENQLLHIYMRIDGVVPFEEECLFDRLVNKSENQLSVSEALISNLEVF